MKKWANEQSLFKERSPNGQKAHEEINAQHPWL
jgi:hypothetical protein